MKEKTTTHNLIKELKNSNWEIKTLEEVITKFISGAEKINKSRENDGNYPAIVCRDIFNSNHYIDGCNYFVDETTIKSKPYVEFGDILMSVNGHTEKNSNGFCLFLGKFNPLIGGNSYILKHNGNPKYLINSLFSLQTKNQINRCFKKYLSTTFFLPLSNVKKIKIPIPSLEIQEKIGNFLFSFAEYEKKLQQELEKRRKQFHYYKEKLFEEVLEKSRLRSLDWEVKELGEIATEIYSGNEVTKVQLGTGDYPAVKCGDINSFLPLQFKECISFVDLGIIKKPKYFEHGDILISNMSNKLSTIGKVVCYSGQQKCLAGDHVVILKTYQNNKFLTYALSTESSRLQIKELSQKGIVHELHRSKLKQIKIPLPNLEEQERIVNILDKFYDVCENPDKGIQLLIKNNKKQYEYYKELIFSYMNIEKPNI